MNSKNYLQILNKLSDFNRDYGWFALQLPKIVINKEIEFKNIPDKKFITNNFKAQTSFPSFNFRKYSSTKINVSKSLQTTEETNHNQKNGYIVNNNTQVSEVLNSSISNNLNYNFNNIFGESKRNSIIVEEKINHETNFHKMKSILDNNYKQKNRKFTNSLISDKNHNIITNKNKFRHSSQNFKFLSQDNYADVKNNNNSNKKLNDYFNNNSKSQNLLVSKMYLMDLKQKYSLPLKIKEQNYDIEEYKNLKHDHNKEYEKGFFTHNDKNQEILEKENEVINPDIDFENENGNRNGNRNRNVLYSNDHDISDEFCKVSSKSDEENITEFEGKIKSITINQEHFLEE